MAKKNVKSEVESKEKAPEAAPEAQEVPKAISAEAAEIQGLCVECGQDPKGCGGEHVAVEFTQDVGINGRMFFAGSKGNLPKNALGQFINAVKLLK